MGRGGDTSLHHHHSLSLLLSLENFRYEKGFIYSLAFWIGVIG
jgi:hypothetical protein